MLGSKSDQKQRNLVHDKISLKALQNAASKREMQAVNDGNTSNSSMNQYLEAKDQFS